VLLSRSLLFWQRGAGSMLPAAQAHEPARASTSGSKMDFFCMAFAPKAAMLARTASAGKNAAAQPASRIRHPATRRG